MYIACFHCAEIPEVCNTPCRMTLPSTPPYSEALQSMAMYFSDKLALRLSQQVDILMTDIQCR